MNEYLKSGDIPENISKHSKDNIIISIAIFFAVMLVYFPVISTNYGYVDDFSFIQSAIDGSNAILNQAASGDRLLSGLLTNFLFHSFKSINAIKYIRAISVILIAAFSIIFFRLLTSSGYDNKSSAAYSILVACTPSFQIYGSWAVLVGAPLSAIFALLAAFSHLRLKKWGLFFFRASMVLMSLLFYQPSAMIFFALLPVALYSRLGNKESNHFNFVLLYILSGFVGMIGAYLMLNVNYALGFSVSHRATITNNIISKAEWFFHGPLISSTNIFMVRPQFLPAFLILILFLFLFTTQKKLRSTPFLLSLACAIPLSYAPNLIVIGDWASNRTLVGLEVLWCGIIFLFLDWLLKSKSQFLTNGFIAAVLIVILLSSQNNIMDEFVIPGSIEYACALHEMRIIDPKNGSTVCIVPSNWTASLARYTSMDDFGGTPFSANWSATSIFYDTLHLLYPKKKVNFIISDNSRCKYTIETHQTETYRIFHEQLYTLGKN